MAFYGLTVSANGTEEVTFPDGAMLNITQIALDEAKDNQSAVVQLQIAQEDFSEENEDKPPTVKNYTICKLTAGKVDQVRVGLKLFSHEEAKITVKGQGQVHITGYLTPDPSYDEEGFDSEDEDEDEIQAALAKRKFGDSMEEEDDEDDAEDTPAVKPPVKQQKTPQGAKPQQGQQQAKPQGGQQKPQGQQGGKPQGQQQGGKKNKGGKN